MKQTEKYLIDKVDSLVSRFNFEDSAVLINIPQVPMEYIEKEVALKRGYFAFHPHSLLYLAACFREANIKRSIIDLNYEVLLAVQNDVEDLNAFWKDCLKREIDKHKEPILCVSFMFEATKPTFIAVCQFLREEYPELCIWTGGVNATADPQQILDDNLADIVWANEGEQNISSFYNYIRGDTERPPCNMFFMDENHEIIETQSQNGGPVDKDIIDEYTLIDTKNYYKAGSISNFSRMVGLDTPFAAVLAKRGCRAKCSFCGVRNFNGKGVRLREVDSVIGEMLHLKETYGITHFDWLDDDLLMGKSQTMLLLNEITDKVKGINWAANNGLIPGVIDAEMYEAFRASGCVGFKVGLESGNPEMLKRIHKPTNLKRFVQFSKLAQDYLDIWVSVNFIVGLPEERFEQMIDSLELAVLSNLHWHNFYIYQHIKNTEFYISFGGMGDDYISKEHGKENSHPLEKAHSENFVNPVRQGGFAEHSGVPTGWDIFNIEPGCIPTRKWINEIWFAFNSVANFILNSGIKSDSEIFILNMIHWLEVLGDAYPTDASMQALKYFLQEKVAFKSANIREAQRSKTLMLFENDYWSRRDKVFNFSTFLDKEVPELPVFLQYLHGIQDSGLSSDWKPYTERKLIDSGLNEYRA
jgi:radical SAM superfamily enzyme YgiQ (UPF0313 family)